MTEFHPVLVNDALTAAEAHAIFGPGVAFSPSSKPQRKWAVVPCTTDERCQTIQKIGAELETQDA